VRQIGGRKPFSVPGTFSEVQVTGTGSLSSRTEEPERTGSAKVYEKTRESIPPDREQAVVLTTRPECPIDLVLAFIDDDLSGPVLVFGDPG
jgi:hypothetical protein